MSDSGSKLGLATLRLYWDILRLRRGPEDLPASLALLVVTVVASVALGIAVSAMSPEPERHATALIAIDSVVLILWGSLLLRVVRRPERFLQMMTAIFGCKLLLQLLAAPAIWLYASHGEDPTLGPLVSLPVIGFIIWSLVIIVRILRSATDWPIIGCVGAVIAQELATLLVVLMIFSDRLPQTG